MEKNFTLLNYDKVRIRSCTSQDLEEIQKIEDVSFEDPFPPSLFLSLLKQYPLGFRVATLEENLAGYCILATSGSIGQIESVAVRPECRNLKIGTKLLLDAISLCTTTFNVNKIFLQVRMDNSNAISLYTKLGFMKEGLLKNYYGFGKDGLSMVLNRV